jgi:hypothetical protein
VKTQLADRIGQHPARRVENLHAHETAATTGGGAPRDEFRPQQACLGVVLALNLLWGGTRQQPENVIPGDADD